jgi:hypothetical protein
VMKPKPLSPLNHFTVPVGMRSPPFLAGIDPEIREVAAWL